MYQISKLALDAFRSCEPQVARIQFNGTTESVSFTEEDIVSGGLSVNRYCAPSGTAEIGSAVASELTLVLKNDDGKFDDVTFEGAELFVRVGATGAYDTRNYIPLGYFTVDNCPRKLSTITLTALDRMVQFDKAVDPEKFPFPMTLDALYTRICNICNVIPEGRLTGLPNASYMVRGIPEQDGLTYRQILSWIAELTATCAYMNWDGRLVMAWYSEVDEEITPGIRTASDLYESAVTITGVKIKNGETTYQSGSEGYEILIEENGLIGDDAQTIADNIAAKVVGFTYMPFSATLLPSPHLYPLDMVSFVDKDGGTHPAILTDCTFALNRNTAVAGKGKTDEERGWAAANPLTNREAAILAGAKKDFNETLTNREQFLLGMNEFICNSLGLYRSEVKNDDGSTSYYMHDQPELADSKVIYTMKAGGIAWTSDGWNNGAPIWNYGVTSAGDAFFRRISADQIETGVLQSNDGESFYLDLDNGFLWMKSSSASVDGNPVASKDDIDKASAELGVSIDGISTQVQLQEETLNGVKTKITDVEQTAGEVSIQVQSILDNGVDKVKTGMGYTFDDSGMHIQKVGDEIENSIDNTGMYVRRGDTDMLAANADGVEATDLTARNYLTIAHARFEAYGTDRTGCFYV